jgi:NAD(P)H-hydrate repair Nnr-like enzyme with NAD(P)H-hydrate dehydratase domain
MNEFDVNDLKKLYVPAPSSHKGQNGKLLIIGGSVLFHAASLLICSGE